MTLRWTKLTSFLAKEDRNSASAIFECIFQRYDSRVLTLVWTDPQERETLVPSEHRDRLLLFLHLVPFWLMDGSRIIMAVSMNASASWQSIFQAMSKCLLENQPNPNPNDCTAQLWPFAWMPTPSLPCKFNKSQVPFCHRTLLGTATWDLLEKKKTWTMKVQGLARHPLEASLFGCISHLCQWRFQVFADANQCVYILCLGVEPTRCGEHRN